MYCLFNFGKTFASERVTVDLGDAAKFATYDEDTRTMKVEGVTLEDVGNYRILVKTYQTSGGHRLPQTSNDQHPFKKYLHIFITDQIDDDRRTELSFETTLSPFDITIGQSSEKILPRIKEWLNGLKTVLIEPDEEFSGALNYNAARNSIEYLP